MRKHIGKTKRLFLSIQTAISCHVIVVAGASSEVSDISNVSLRSVFKSDRGSEISKSDKLCKKNSLWSTECCKLNTV